jgi:hypothetical protein
LEGEETELPNPALTLTLPTACSTGLAAPVTPVVELELGEEAELGLEDGSRISS